MTEPGDPTPAHEPYPTDESPAAPPPSPLLLALWTGLAGLVLAAVGGVIAAQTSTFGDGSRGDNTIADFIVDLSNHWVFVGYLTALLLLASLALRLPDDLSQLVLVAGALAAIVGVLQVLAALVVLVDAESVSFGSGTYRASRTASHLGSALFCAMAVMIAFGTGQRAGGPSGHGREPDQSR